MHFVKKIIFIFLSHSILNLKFASATKTYCRANFNITTADCNEIFARFHKCTGKFLESALNNSNPFTLCTDQHAYDSYRNMIYFLDLLMSKQDPKNHNKTCSDEYLYKNQMSVISTIVSTSKGLWEQAFCDDCYANTSTADQIFSDHMKQFTKLHLQYTTCTHNKNSTMICKQCEEDYLQMNILFNHHKEKGGRICFDLEDIMNKTRQEWSGVYRCCKDKRDSLTAFFSLFSTIMVLAVVFYGSLYCIGSHYPPPIDVLDAREISQSASTITPSSSSSTGPSSSANVKIKDRKVLNKSINNDESDDDELLIKASTPINSNNNNNNQLITLD